MGEFESDDQFINPIYEVLENGNNSTAHQWEHLSYTLMFNAANMTIVAPAQLVP
jgi:hypothetical protein